MSSKKETCKNCEKKFKENFSFCPFCGQQAKDELTFGVLFYNTISNYFSFDARFFKSFLPLILKPGFLAREFVNGKRLKYLHPAQMYLFVAVIFFFLFSFVQREQVKSLDAALSNDSVNIMLPDDDIKDSLKLRVNELDQIIKDSISEVGLKKSLSKYVGGNVQSNAQIDSIVENEKAKWDNTLNLGFNSNTLDSLITIGASDDVLLTEMGISENSGFFEKRVYEQSLKLYKSKKGGGILQTFYDAVPLAMFFLLPIFALILKLFFRKRGRYAHHLVFSFYYFSFLFTVFSIILGINFIWDVPDWLDWLIILSTFIYLFLAIKRYYRQVWFISLIKSALSTFIFLSIVAPLTVVILGVFAFLFY